MAATVLPDDQDSNSHDVNAEKISILLGGREELRHVYVMGGIGVGKTSLVRAASTTHAVYEEYVNNRLLGDYIGNPERYAYSFQLVMMQGACTRTMDAEKTLWSAARAARAPYGIVVERPAQENIIFAKANHLCKNISDANYTQYCIYVKQFNLDLAEQRALTQNTVPNPNAFQLWAPEYMTFKRMIERNRISEDGYLDTYMCTLPHVYFVGYIELMMARNLLIAKNPCYGMIDPLLAFRTKEYLGVRFNAEDSICPEAILPIVIDWTNYGSWDAIAHQLAATDIQAWNQQAGNVILQFQQADVTADLMHNTVNGTVDHVTCVDNHYTFNLSWYIRQFKADLTNKLLAPFRDMFFKARATRCKLTLVVDHTLFEDQFLLNIFTPYPTTQRVTMVTHSQHPAQEYPLLNEYDRPVPAGERAAAKVSHSFDFWNEGNGDE